MNLIEHHQYPIDDGGWYRKINICPNCELHTIDEISLFVPCWRCGYIGGVSTVVAKWVPTFPRAKWWQVWKRANRMEGKWEKAQDTNGNS